MEKVDFEEHSGKHSIIKSQAAESNKVSIFVQFKKVISVCLQGPCVAHQAYLATFMCCSRSIDQQNVKSVSARVRF